MGQMEVITEETQIKRHQDSFRRSFEDAAKERIVVKLGFQGGQFEREVLWLPELNLWAHFGFPGEEKSPGERYWNAFGLGRPNGLMNIGCEINPPVRGLNRRAAGIFLQSHSGDVYIGHRGNINAKGRIPKAFFYMTTSLELVKAKDGDSFAKVALVSQLHDDNLDKRVRDFVVEIARVKNLYREVL